jgi:alpha-mannosidase
VNKTITIHLIPNAHIDPVWLWDWREGLNQGISTCRAVLDLMDEYPELTFIRGEAAIYAHIEKHDPATFRRIVRRVKDGRWDIVGGNWVQPDTNLPATETFLRQFLRGVRYFHERFGVRVRIGWAADSFGHAAGMPDILAAAGMEGYSFTRPFPSQFPIPCSAFWWEGAGGGRVLCYRPPVGWYGCERDEIATRLDAVLKFAATDRLANVACYYGLGNHGGGPSRRQIEDIRRWAAAHPEVQVVHSTLHGLFRALHTEAKGRGGDYFPTHRGELNFCLRGCYASVAKLKFAYRKAEAGLTAAETADTCAAAVTHTPVANLRDAWDGLLFNAFHDILPGTSIERAMDEQLSWLGQVNHAASTAQFEALTRLAARVDTTVNAVTGDRPTAVPFLVWNPHPRPFTGHVELEENLDGRPIAAYTNRVSDLPLEVRDPQGRRVRFQVLPVEHTAMPQFAWRKRVAIPVKLPPMGWGVYTFGYVEGAPAPEPSVKLAPRTIRNTHLDVRVTGDAVVIRRVGGRELTRITAVTVEDPWGSWGDNNEKSDAAGLSQVRDTWHVTAAETLACGPERYLLGVKLAAGHSELDLRIGLWRDRAAVDVSARVLWNERSARLKLAFTGVGETAEFDVPGASVVRPPLGEVPGGRWVRSGAVGFASDALYGFDLKDGVLRATVCRTTRYADDLRREANEVPWVPVVDRGELKFRFLVTPDLAALPRLAAELERPPVTLSVPASPGRLPRAGALLDLRPAALELLALKPVEAGGGVVLRARAPRACRAAATWLGQTLDLGPVRAGEIATWRLRAGKATRLDAVEMRSRV